MTERMLDLFRSNGRSLGIFDPKTGKMYTEYRGLTVKDLDAHLRGAQGVGAVPILDDGVCHWGAIDIDNHGQDEDIPIGPIVDKIETGRLPLIACRSKSGGVHVYMFLKDAIPAARLRVILGMWAGLLGYGNSEVFPKQSKLVVSSTGKQQLGNWINLPYLGGNDTVRYAVKGGKKLTLQQFIEAAEKVWLTADDMSGLMAAGHEQAPPCIQKLLANGAAVGNRNEALFNITVYLRKAFPNDFEGRAKEINGLVFTKPLPQAETNRTINSAARPDYTYRCGEEPIRSLCDRTTCLNRKFGITKAEADTIVAMQTLPAFSGLTKYLSEPVRWELKIDGCRVTNVSTQQLLEWKCMRELIAEKLTRVVPLIKNNEWERVLSPMMADARIVDTPDDASVAGVVRERLREFASKTNLTSKGEDPADRRALSRGLPVVQVVDGIRQVVFRAQDFINYLKRTRSEELKGVNLWFAVRDLGVQHVRMRAGESNINVWFIPVDELTKNRDEATIPKFESDL